MLKIKIVNDYDNTEQLIGEDGEILAEGSPTLDVEDVLRGLKIDYEIEDEG